MFQSDKRQCPTHGGSVPARDAAQSFCSNFFMMFTLELFSFRYFTLKKFMYYSFLSNASLNGPIC